MNLLETAKGITILRDQALGLMSMVWTPFTFFYGEVMVDAIRCAAANRDDKKPFAAMVDIPGKKGQEELVEVNIEDLKGNILAAPVVWAVARWRRSTRLMRSVPLLRRSSCSSASSPLAQR